MEAAWNIAVICIALAISFLLSGMEAGLFALSRVRIRQLRRKGNHSATLLYRFLENPEDFLWTILAGNTIANLTAVALITIHLQMLTREHPSLFVVGFLVLVFLLFAIGDLLPKMIFRKFPNRLCLFMAYPFLWIHGLLRPVVAAMSWLAGFLLRHRAPTAYSGSLFGNRDELRIVMQESSQSLSSEERQMIGRVLDFQTMQVDQAVQPIERVESISADATLQELVELARTSPRSRFPVWQGARDQIVGMISLDQILFGPEKPMATRVADIMQPALVLEGTMKIDEALRRIQSSGERLALVRDASGKIRGAVSWQDILKIIFGEVRL